MFHKDFLGAAGLPSYITPDARKKRSNIFRDMRQASFKACLFCWRLQHDTCRFGLPVPRSPVGAEPHTFGAECRHAAIRAPSTLPTPGPEAAHPEPGPAFERRPSHKKAVRLMKLPRWVRRNPPAPAEGFYRVGSSALIGQNLIRHGWCLLWKPFEASLLLISAWKQTEKSEWRAAGSTSFDA